jgi:hypothetical protein
MPVSLQESAAFTILGDCGRHPPKELEEYCFNKLEQLPMDANFFQKEHFGTRRNNAMIGSVGIGIRVQVMIIEDGDVIVVCWMVAESLQSKRVVGCTCIGSLERTLRAT